ncbi:MAG: FHA domain-containing protein [Vicinamibacteria bacterium]|nr:FHA domain-containing protein [Vicinamibacteria bacterium]
MPIIGREAPADIVIPAAQVSARHAELQPLGGDLYQLTDLGSTNGTFVNGQRIQSAQVRLSDAVSFGSLPVDLRRYVQPIAAPAVAQRPFAADGRPNPGRLATPEYYAPRPVSPAPQVQRSPAPGLGTDLAVALAAQKSFTGHAFLTFALYGFFWLPGVIMNFVFLNEAKGVQKLTGQAPPGMGCLTILLVFCFWIPLILLILAVLAGGAMVTSILSALS